jgi:hypothetical protein
MNSAVRSSVGLPPSVVGRPGERSAPTAPNRSAAAGTAPWAKSLAAVSISTRSASPAGSSAMRFLATIWPFSSMTATSWWASASRRHRTVSRLRYLGDIARHKGAEITPLKQYPDHVRCELLSTHDFEAQQRSTCHLSCRPRSGRLYESRRRRSSAATNVRKYAVWAAGTGTMEG